MPNTGTTAFERPGPHYRPGNPVVFVFSGPNDSGDDFAARAGDMFPEAIVLVASEPGSDGVTEHLDRLKPAGAVGIGCGEGAGRLASILTGTPSTMSAIVLMHPPETDIAGASDALAGRRVLITAGGRDPASPPEATGALAESLEAHGATVKVVWHAGGGEIADSEYDALGAFLDDFRASLIDVKSLPIEREQDESGKGRYLVRGPADVTAEMSYRQTGADQLIIDHTEVPDAFRGTGTGMRLLKALMADARDEGRKIIPICPFAAAQFDKHPEWSDRLAYRVHTKGG